MGFEVTEYERVHWIQRVGSNEHENGPSGFVKGGELHGEICDYLLLN
jgi:hypothetical protein